MNNFQIPRPEHPEPMMRRDSFLNLNGEWMFSFDFDCSGYEKGFFKADSDELYEERIVVPFCPESKLSGLGHLDFIPAVWYKRKIEITKEMLSGRVILHFGAVDYECRVFVNGVEIGVHFGGYSSFSFDITDLLHTGLNDLTVNAKDDQRSGKQPKGKQSNTYNSSGCDYSRTTGIWQTVWLETVPENYIKCVKYFPDVDECSLDIEAFVSGCGRFRAEAFYEGRPCGSVSKNVTGRYARVRLPLSEKHLWEVGHGRIYDICLTFESPAGTDTVSSYAGLRDIRIDGFRVLLNGKSVFQRTVLDQGYYPDGIYTAPSDEALAHDIELAQRLGFNGARLHQKMFEPRFLYHCDVAGYLVWSEHASWGINLECDGALLSFLPEWCEMIERDFNHPAIVGWCPFNETWYGEDDTAPRIRRAVYEVTKQLDPTRPVIDVSGGFHTVTDIFDQHDYDQDPESFRKSYINYDGKADSFRLSYRESQVYTPNLPLFISEFGGIKWTLPDNSGAQCENAWGYGDAPQSEDEFFTRYEGLVSALLDSPNIMGFCYTQLYDIEQEVNGLYTYRREEKFSDYSRIIAANTKKAAIE